MKYSQEELNNLILKYGKEIPVRPHDKKNRYFIDNESIERGYMAAFRRRWLIYDILAKHANAKIQACFPSYDTIMREGGFKNRNMIPGTIAAFVELNIIAIREVAGINSTVYYLVDSSRWKPVTSIVGDTGRVVLKQDVKRYLKQQKTSNVSDTLNQLKKSTKEIISNKSLENIEEYKSLKPLDNSENIKREKALQELRDRMYKIFPSKNGK